MKKHIYVFIAIFTFASTLSSNPCLDLVGRGIEGYHNFDSVMVDTCTNSPTFGKWYARNTYQFHAETYIFQLKPLSVDSIYSWKDIDTNLVDIRNAFQDLETVYGEYIFRRYDNESDSDHIRVPKFTIEFESYHLTDSMIETITSINSIDYCKLLYPPNMLYISDISKNNLNLIINQNENTLIIDFQNTKLQELTNIKIFDIFGNCVYENRIFNESQKISIDISLLNNGIYFIGINEKTYKFSVVR